jgi:hypothetical protein
VVLCAVVGGALRCADWALAVPRSLTGCPIPRHHTHHTHHQTHSILYQRGVYPTDDFRPEQQYGLKLLLTKNEQLKKYLDTIIKQMSGAAQTWLGLC